MNFSFFRRSYPPDLSLSRPQPGGERFRKRRNNLGDLDSLIKAVRLTCLTSRVPEMMECDELARDKEWAARAALIGIAVVCDLAGDFGFLPAGIVWLGNRTRANRLSGGRGMVHEFDELIAARRLHTDGRRIGQRLPVQRLNLQQRVVELLGRFLQFDDPHLTADL